MISSSEFVEKWEAFHADDQFADWGLIKLNSSNCETTIPNNSLRFLQEAGLPKSAAPCLSFDDIARGLKRIYEIFGIPKDWNDEDRERLKFFLVIGFDGSGNLICIDEGNQGRVVLIDHDDWFTTIQFVNASIPQLAESLFLYESSRRKLPTQRDTNNPIENQLVNEVIEQLLKEMEKIDAAAVRENCFWWYEIDNLYYT